MNDKQRDSAVAIGVFITSVALRVPFRSTLPYHWDGAEFALAISEYNIIHSQPHAPGYFLYVMLGRLVNLMVGDPHASLVWLSVLAGSLLVPVLYWLGTAMFDRRTGMIAALLAMTSPQTWFHSEVALTYIVDALLVSVTVLVCWRAVQRGGSWTDAVLIGVLLAIVGGVRQQSVLALGPVLLYVFWNFCQPRFAKLLVSALTAFLLGLAWFLPMVAMTGGWHVYFEIVRRHTAFNAPATWVGGGLDALVWNVFFAALFTLNGLMLAAVAVVVPILRRSWRWESRPFQLLAAWVGGMWVMATIIGFTKQPGYVLNFLPGLFLLAASTLAQWRWPVTVVVCAINLFGFVGWPHSWDRVWFGTARTAREIRVRDQQLRDTVAAIRQQCNPDDTIVCHAGEYLHFGLKQFQLLLPDFEQIQLRPDPTMLTPPGKPLMAVRAGRLVFVSRDELPDRKAVVLIVPPDLTLKVFGLTEAQPLPGAGGTAFLSRQPIHK
jgi:hypothetical protein